MERSIDDIAPIMKYKKANTIPYLPFQLLWSLKSVKGENNRLKEEFLYRLDMFVCDFMEEKGIQINDPKPGLGSLDTYVIDENCRSCKKVIENFIRTALRIELIYLEELKKLGKVKDICWKRILLNSDHRFDNFKKYCSGELDGMPYTLVFINSEIIKRYKQNIELLDEHIKNINDLKEVLPNLSLSKFNVQDDLLYILTSMMTMIVLIISIFLYVHVKIT